MSFHPSESQCFHLLTTTKDLSLQIARHYVYTLLSKGSFFSLLSHLSSFIDTKLCGIFSLKCWGFLGSTYSANSYQEFPELTIQNIVSEVLSKQCQTFVVFGHSCYPLTMMVMKQSFNIVWFSCFNTPQNFTW